MAIINPDLSSSKRAPIKEPKRMLEFFVNKETRKMKLIMNFSSYDIIMQCVQKAKHRLHDKLTAKEEAAALTTGKGVHKAMEVWYSASKENRKHSSMHSDDSIDLMLGGSDPLPGSDARVASVFAYLEATKDLRGNMDLGARAQENVCDILNNYFDFYLNDGLEVYRDDLGPFVERSAEFYLLTFEYYGWTIELWYHGTIDMVLQDTFMKELIVTDHKTTSSLGKDFLNRIRPNWQYVGYFEAALHYYKLPVKRFMVNGIQIAKTKRDFNRQKIEIRLDEMESMRASFMEASKRYVEAYLSGNWAMSTPNSCSMWGGCEYKTICSLPPNLRSDFIKSNYER